MKNKISALKLASLLNSLDLNETVQTKTEAVRVNKGEYKRTFNSDFFLNLESRGVSVVKEMIESHFQGLENQLQYRLEYSIDSREFTLTVRIKQRLPSVPARESLKARAA